MGRKGSCGKQEVNRGAWSAEEDKILIDHVRVHGEGKWRELSKRAGLNRCGKSCRLRWLNYLKPDIKRGNISSDEEDLIIRLHRLLGNRWALIAGRLPGRTDNEIKNYWNTYLRKKTENKQNHNKLPSQNTNNVTALESPGSSKNSLGILDPTNTKVMITTNDSASNTVNLISNGWDNQNPSTTTPQFDDQDCSISFLKEFDIVDNMFVPYEDCCQFNSIGDSIGDVWYENWNIDHFFHPEQALDFSSFSKFQTWDA